jgi:hypothetical protein
MRNRRFASMLFFLAAIGFFVAGGLGLRAGTALGVVYMVLGGALIASGAAVKRRRGQQGV